MVINSNIWSPWNEERRVPKYEVRIKAVSTDEISVCVDLSFLTVPRTGVCADIRLRYNKET